MSAVALHTLSTPSLPPYPHVDACVQALHGARPFADHPGEQRINCLYALIFPPSRTKIMVPSLLSSGYLRRGERMGRVTPDERWVKGGGGNGKGVKEMGRSKGRMEKRGTWEWDHGLD